jgi:hypothetical protein
VEDIVHLTIHIRFARNIGIPFDLHDMYGSAVALLKNLGILGLEHTDLADFVIGQDTGRSIIDCVEHLHKHAVYNQICLRAEDLDRP